MTLDPTLIHPSVRRQAGNLAGLRRAVLPPTERVYADTLLALVDSLRSPAEMAEAAQALNPLLDARMAADDPARCARLDEIAGRALKAAQGARDSRSGMAVDLSLDFLRSALDDARSELGMLEGR